MHENQFIHRDIKPENILLVKFSKDITLYKVGDPGIAKDLNHIES